MATSVSAKCPKCGEVLENRKFVDSYNAQGKPEDVNESLYCPKCDLRWSEEKGPHEFEETFRGKWFCPKCGGEQFKVLTEQQLKDVQVYNGDRGAEWNYSDATIEHEKILEIVCVKCGSKVYQKCESKPIPKKRWEETWSSHIADFIVAFDHYVACLSSEEPEDKFEAYLWGLSRGMWAIYNLIEAEMVEDK